MLYCFRYLLHNDVNWTGRRVRCRWPVIIDLHGLSHRRSIIVSIHHKMLFSFPTNFRSKFIAISIFVVFSKNVTRCAVKSENSMHNIVNRQAAVGAIVLNLEERPAVPSAARTSHTAKASSWKWIARRYVAGVYCHWRGVIHLSRKRCTLNRLS